MEGPAPGEAEPVPPAAAGADPRRVQLLCYLGAMDGQGGPSLLVRDTAAVSGLTLLSRVLGYLRDRVAAHLLGTSFAADAFYLAFRIPNTVRRLVAEGALASAIVPELARASADGDGGGRSDLLGRRILWTFGALGAAIGIAGALMAPWVVRVLAWDFRTTAPDAYRLAGGLTAALFPYVALAGIAALFSSLLYARGAFALPTLSLSVLNATVILGALVLAPWLDSPAWALAWAVLLGGLLQAAVQVPSLRGLGGSLRPAWGWSDPAVRRLVARAVPAIFGAGASQVIFLLATVLAHTAGEGAVSALYFANRLEEIAFGLVTVPLSLVALPSLARATGEGDRELFLATLRRVVSLGLFLIVPAALGLAVLAKVIVRVLFQTGEFTGRSADLTAGPLVWLAAGLVPWGVGTLLVRASHGLGNVRGPLCSGLAALGLFAITGPAACRLWAAEGIAGAFSVSGFVYAGILVLSLRKRLGLRFLPGPGWCARLLASAAAAALAATGTARIWPPHSGWDGALALFTAVASALILFAGLSWVFGMAEIRELRGAFGKGATR